MDLPLFFDDVSGDRLAGLISQPSQPNGRGVVLLHCFTCTKHHRIMRRLSEGLTGKGFTVLRFDFSGNGESGGRLEDSTYTKMIREIKSAVTVLEGRGLRSIGVVGHSMGAMLGILAAHEDKRIREVCFIAGSSQAARVREVFPKEAIERAEAEGSAEAIVYGRQMKLHKEFLLDIENYNVGLAVATLRRPLLIIHGAKDETIAPFHARQLYNWASPPKSLELIEGADHLFKTDAHLDEVVSLAADWLERA